MPNKCNYCGEEKLCRFEEDINSVISNIGMIFRNRWGEFICEDCDNYLKHKREIERRKRKEDMKKKKREFVKERDKFLKVTTS